MSDAKRGNAYHLGKPHSEETKRKIGLNTANASNETRRRMSEAHRGKKLTEATKRKMSDYQKGRKRGPMSEAQKLFLSNLKKGFVGEKNPNWRGGVSAKAHIIRTSREYALWRTAVLQRDCFTCQWCGQQGGDIEVDHIQEFAVRPDLRLAVDNGRALCKLCHRKRHAKSL